MTETERASLIAAIEAAELESPEQVADLVIDAAEKDGYEAGLLRLEQCQAFPVHYREIEPLTNKRGETMNWAIESGEQTEYIRGTDASTEKEAEAIYRESYNVWFLEVSVRRTTPEENARLAAE